MASMHRNRKKNGGSASHWRDACFELSEKKQSQFFEKNGIVYCEYFEKGKLIKKMVG